MAARMKPKSRTRRAGRTGRPNKSDLPFERGTVHYDVASEMVKSGEHSWDELIEAAGGVLSTRTFGFVLRGLEDAGFRFNRRRDAEWGTCYELDTSGNAETLAKRKGPDDGGPSTRGAKKKAAPAKKTRSNAAAARRKAMKRPASKPAPRPTARGKVKPRPRRRARR